MFEYSKENRILKNREYQTMYADSSKWVSTSFVVLGRITENLVPRLGVVVSKKIGGAVTRNRIKRLCREAFRNNKGLYPSLDVVLIARRGVANTTGEMISLDVKQCLSRIYKKLLLKSPSREGSYER